MSGLFFKQISSLLQIGRAAAIKNIRECLFYANNFSDGESVGKALGYSLYKDRSSFILSVLCGNVGLFEINMILSEEEKAEFHSQGELYIEKTGESHTVFPSQFFDRHIKALLLPD